jgi:hypothetical protein
MKIHLNIIFPSTPGASKFSLSIKLPNTISICTFPLPQTGYLHRPSQSFRFDHPHGVCSTITVPRKCVNSSYAFCCISHEVTCKYRRRSFTPLINKCYGHYFGCKVGGQNKSWAPHFSCGTCARLFAAWAKCSRCMPFAIPMVWRELIDHVSDCYFCLSSITGVTANSNTLFNILIYHVRWGQYLTVRS